MISVLELLLELQIAAAMEHDERAHAAASLRWIACGEAEDVVEDLLHRAAARHHPDRKTCQRIDVDCSSSSPCS